MLQVFVLIFCGYLLIVFLIVKFGLAVDMDRHGPSTRPRVARRVGNKILFHCS